MDRPHDAIALQLKERFAAIYKTSQKPAILRLKKRRVGGRFEDIQFDHPGAWPAACYELMNAALLSLHHAGLIMYGANTIRLHESLLRDSPVGEIDIAPGAEADAAV